MCALIEKFEKNLTATFAVPASIRYFLYINISTNQIINQVKFLKWCGQALSCSKMAEGSGGGIRQTAAGNQAYGDESETSAAKRLNIRREGGAYGNEKAEHTATKRQNIR